MLETWYKGGISKLEDKDKGEDDQVFHSNKIQRASIKESCGYQECREANRRVTDLV